MFFSRSKDEPVEAASASTASTSASTNSTIPATAAADAAYQGPSEEEWQAKGAAGLGAISSLSPECTPLKHRYDSCFNSWFKDYLAIGDDQIQEQQRQSEASSSGTASPSSQASSSGKKKSGWFSDSSSASSASTSATSIDGSDIERRKQAIMERYDRDCAKLFKDYQACVKVSQCDAAAPDALFISFGSDEKEQCRAAVKE